MKYLLKEIARVQMGLSFRSRIEPEADGNIAVIQMRDLTVRGKLGRHNLVKVKMNGINDRHLVRRKDLIFRSRGKTTNATIIDKEIEFAVVAAPLLRIRVTSKNILPEYLCWFVNQKAAQGFLHSRATGTAMVMIGKSALDGLQVPLPTLENQEHIVALADWSEKEQWLMRDVAERKAKLVNGVQMLLATEPEHFETRRRC